MRIVVTCYILLLVFLSPLAQETIFTEDFSGGELPENWSIIDNDGNLVDPSVSEFGPAWIVLQDPNDTTNYVAGSTSYFDPPDVASRWLVTPEIELGEFGNYISWYARSHDPSYPDSYRVYISNSGNSVNDFSTVLGTYSSETNDGIHREVLIPDEYSNEKVRIAFVNITFNGFKLYVDSIGVRKEDPLTTQDYAIEKLLIYPNPVIDEFTIQSLDATEKEIKIVDVSGKTVYFEKTSENSINTIALQSGMYFVEVTTNGRRFHTKIIKE